MSLGNKLESFEPAKRVGSLFDEFKNFAFKGNVVDLAIGVIIGAAFGTIVKSLTDNIIMPIVSLVLPNDGGFETWKLVLASHVDPNTGKAVVDKAIMFGKFLGDLLNFIIVAFVLFLFIKKFLGLILKEKAAAPPPPTKDQELLTEIRDLLKKA